MNEAHVLNQRIAKSFCFRPLTDVLTPKSSAPPGGPHFGSNSPLYGSLTRVKCPGIAWGGGGWAVLEYGEISFPEVITNGQTPDSDR